jgi:hypothetical protein
MIESLILLIVVLIGGAVVRTIRRRRQAAITTDLIGRPLSGGQTPVSSHPKTYVLKAPAPSKPKHMDLPVERLFTFRDEYDAASARQRVWVRYKDMRGNETDRKIEIYYPQDDE